MRNARIRIDGNNMTKKKKEKEKREYRQRKTEAETFVFGTKAKHEAKAYFIPRFVRIIFHSFSTKHLFCLSKYTLAVNVIAVETGLKTHRADVKNYDSCVSPLVSSYSSLKS